MPSLKRLFASGTIQARLLTIALVPSAAALLVGVSMSAYLVNQGLQQSNFADKLGDAAGTTTRFVSGVQDERRLTLQWVSDRRQDRAPLDGARAETDAAVTEMETLTERLESGAPDDLATALSDFRAKMDEVKEIRGQADAGPGDLDAVYSFYNELLTSFDKSMRAFARSAPDAAVGYEQVTAIDLYEAAEALSRGHALAAARTQTGMTQQQFHEYIHQIGAYHQDLESLKPRMTEQERGHYKQISAAPPWKQLDSVQKALEAAGGQANSQEVVRLPVNTLDWQRAQRDVTNELDSLYREHSDSAAAIGTNHASTTLTTSLVSGSAILVIAGAVFLVAFRLSRKLIRRLTRLREETLDLAERDLPTIVERLRNGERIDVEAEVAWLNHGDDEVGQVAEAFNKAQRMAITSTVQEAETRQGVRSVFLNIAHRSQVMVHRQLKTLDQAERSQEDPQQLEMLFQLDHLATQSRRNAENLVILGGERPGRQWRNPVSLLEVVRGAVAEIEHYTRVETGHLPEVALQGAVVADLIHLVAELLDNATSFSPPESHVEVFGNVVGKGIVVVIDDQGLGIDEDKLEELNAMLRNPPDFGVMALSSESRMGLFVVAQLAARHDIRITLRDSAYGGVQALVLIPTAVIAKPSNEDGFTDVGAWPAVQDQQESAQPKPSQPHLSGNLNSDTAQTPIPSSNSDRMVPNTPSNGKASSNGSAPRPAPTGQHPNHSNPPPTSDGGGPHKSSRGDEQRPPLPRQRPRPADAPSPPRNEAPQSNETPRNDAPRNDSPWNALNGNPEPMRGNGSGPAIGGAKRPLPQRQRQANLAAPLRESASRERSEPEQKPATQDGPPRSPEQFRATMSAFQHGTRRARVSDADAHPGTGRPKGEEA